MINFNFSSENHLLSLFIRVRIELHFTLESPVTYFLALVMANAALYWTDSILSDKWELLG